MAARGWIYETAEEESDEASSNCFSLAQLAHKELHEEANNVPAHLKSFKRWLSTARHLSCCQTDKFLLAFLRQAKFEHAKAQKKLDEFCCARASSQKGRPEWFQLVPLDDPMVDKYLSAGHQLSLGTMADGSRLVIIKAGVYHTGFMDKNTFLRLFFMNIDRGLFDNRMQIGGITLLVDFSDFKEHTVPTSKDLHDIKDEVTIVQHAYPFRIKHIIYYKASFFLDKALNCIELCLPSKMRKRVIHDKGTLEKAKKRLPDIETHLPLEYGGKNGSLNYHIEKLKTEFHRFYRDGQLVGECQYDSKSRREAEEGELLGHAGTYIKIEQDF